MKTRLLALVAVLSASNPLLRATDIEMKIDLAGTERTVVIRLDEAIAPKTSANFAKLCREDFYKGVAMHRVIPNYIVQTGDPLSKEPVKRSDWGTGGPGYTLPAELGGKHVRGAVAAARLGDQANPDRASSGSQFYVVLRDIPQLDGQYTVFGKVISGLETFIEIASAPSDDAKVPTVPISFLSSRVLGEESPAPVEKPGVPKPVPAVARAGADKPKSSAAATATAAVTGEKPADGVGPEKSAPKQSLAATATASVPETKAKPVATAVATPPPAAKPEPAATGIVAAPVMAAAAAGDGPEKSVPKQPSAAETAKPTVPGAVPVPPKNGSEVAAASIKPLPAVVSEPDPLASVSEPDEEKPLVPMTKLTLNDTSTPPSAGLVPEPPPAKSAPAAIVPAEPEPDPLGTAPQPKAEPATEVAATISDAKKEPSISDLATDTMRVNGDRGLPPVRLDPNYDALARATESIAPRGDTNKAADPNDGFVPLSSVGNLSGYSWQTPPSPKAPPLSAAPAPVESVSGSGFSFASSAGTDFEPKAKPKTAEPASDPEPKPEPANVTPAPKPKSNSVKAPAETAMPAPKPAAPESQEYQPLAVGAEPPGAGQSAPAPAAAPEPAPASAAQDRPKGFIGRFIRRVW